MGNKSTMMLKSTCELFNSLMVIEHSLNVSITELLKYFLEPISLSSASPKGSMVKIVKSNLLKDLEKNSIYILFHQMPLGF